MSVATLPTVCAWCERVRTSTGRWEAAAAGERDSALATHGICPDCLAQETHAAGVADDLPAPLILARARSIP